ncbi:MAG: phosphotransferase [Pontiella sp.]
MDISDYEKIFRNWHVVSPILCEEIQEPARAEQPALSTTFVDTNKDRWSLERIAEETYSRKLSIAETLELLENQGCNQIHPYKRNSLGQFITAYSGQLFMLRPQIKGIAMPLDTWNSEGWRPDAMADFIISLHQTAAGISIPNDGKAYAIIDFVKRKTEAFDRHRPEVSDSLNRVFHVLEDSLFPALSSLPTAFCHGDFNPMNIVWGTEVIRSVTHWELCGFKPEAYDAALIVGCIGFHNPDMLISDFTTRFIRRLRDAALYTEGTWEIFYELVIATRYGWLSEWMYTHDEKSRDLETLYMNLLVTQKNYILKKWELA